ncbi:MAG: beta-L-arabinofuranosidase domain-containing protein [Verrucomicrobiota bacterium]
MMMHLMRVHRLPQLGLIAVLATLGTVTPSAFAGEVAPVVSFKASPFAMQDVRLLDGPFKTAMERDSKYMLSLDPDRFLHNFRVNAGLPSTAEPLGHWEKPKSELRGHLTGHYLSACALMYASTGDERFNDRVNLLVRELAKCQAALGDSGYLSAFPETYFDRVETTGKVWAPYYTLHKVLAGLLDAHTLCGNSQALEVAGKFGGWVKTRTDKLSDAQVEKMLGVEHGGINESMANLYALTGDLRHLQTARRLYHKAVLEPLAAREDKLSGLHANTQFPKVIGLARLYELTGEERYHTSAEFFWDRVVNHHSYVIGGNSDHEHFGPPDQLNTRISPWTAESCNTYNMLKLTRQVFSWDASAAQADYYERALYNHILASQDPRTGLMAYHIPVHGAWFMPYNTPNDSCWCCTGTGFENHAKYGDSIYWHDNDGLFVNLFIPSELNWRTKGLVVRQETRYPEEDTTRLEFKCAQPCTLALRIRYPAWAQRGMTITVNGEIVPHQAAPASFATLRRTWKSGDRVEVKLPMTLRLEPMPDNPTRAAICYGPVVLAGELGTNGIVPPMPYANSQSDFFKVKPPAAPVLLTQNRPVTDWVQPVPGKPLTFQTKGVGRPSDLTLTAFYAMTPQRYSIYWDMLTAEQYQARLTDEENEARRAQAWAARTVDSVKIGDDTSEKAHNLKGENTSSGPFSSRTYRHALNGGWFAYDLKVTPDQPAKLLCTYWGNDGVRTFDLTVNGTFLATQKLNREHPGEFFDVEYDLPPAVIAGQSKVTIKFRGQPGQTAGGLFDLRILKP